MALLDVHASMNNHNNVRMPGTQTQSRHQHSRSHNGSIGNGLPQHENGAMPLPVRSQRPRGMTDTAPGMLDAARSPPKNKNTAHVPCKFYLQGQCQAGRMCPFSHDLESTTRPAPCKYFAKGHCKFGAKCALLHITPDGIIVNRRQYQPAPYSGNAQPNGYGPPPPGLLSLQAQALERQPNVSSHEFGYPFTNGHEMPQFDYTTASPPKDQIATSPPRKGLSVLDAPLPNSFDSNGISLAARHGPFAASVPSRFGIDSPSSSAPSKSHFGNHALQELHSSAFGDSTLDSMLVGSSPPSGDELLTFPKRTLYSDRLRASRQMFSASFGAAPPRQFDLFDDDDDDDDEVDIDHEENLLPASLRDLIPEGRSRRESRATKEDDTPASFLAAQRRTLSSNTTPQESKVGSPSFSSSPSRYTGMFAQRSASSDFVGSPLRNAGFPTALSSSATQAVELSHSLNSPPRQASMSMLTQGLQRTKLDQARSQVNGASHPPPTTRTLSSGSSGRASIDRALSGTSIGRERIDEEQELFDMDELGTSSRPQSSGTGQASSTILSRLTSNTKAEATHGAIGSQRTK